MASGPGTNTLDEPVTQRMRRDYAQLRTEQTVGEALAWLREHPPGGRVIYFYVVNGDGVLQGVVPTRRLILTSPGARIADIMVTKLTAVPATATVLEACEFFILYRLLAFPVVDNTGRLVGIVDIDLYTDELAARKPITPVSRWLKPIVAFLHVQSASGIVLMVATVIALVVANSPWADDFTRFWDIHFSIGFLGLALEKSLGHWISDGLMTLFFFVVGLEIKREIVAGELSDWHKALLPIVAALGGMVAPAGIYIALHWGKPTLAGWGIPMATDIAFVVGFLALLGRRVPHSLKVLLLSLAIADDIGATLVIALVYTKELSLIALAVGGVGFAIVMCFRWIGVRAVPAYAVLGTIIWVAFVKSGVHPTVAGVGLGLLTPARPWRGAPVPMDVVTDLFRRIGGTSGEIVAQRIGEPVSPLDRLEQNLHPWVAFVIMPVFALANAGVWIEPSRVWATSRSRGHDRVGRGQADRHHAVLLDGRQARRGANAGGHQQQDPARRRLPGGHRLHDVTVHRRAGDVRRPSGRGEDRHPRRLGHQRGAWVCNALAVSAARHRTHAGRLSAFLMPPNLVQ